MTGIWQRLLGKVCFPFESPRIDENDRRKGESQVEQRYFCSPGSLVPVGKTFGRRELLHILIYFKEGILPCPFTDPPTGIDAPDTVQERSTCFSMETGYLPVTFCGKISSGADPVAFVRACVERWSEFRSMRSCLRGWLVRYRVSKEKSIPISRYLSPSTTLTFRLPLSSVAWNFNLIS